MFWWQWFCFLCTYRLTLRNRHTNRLLSYTSYTCNYFWSDLCWSQDGSWTGLGGALFPPLSVTTLLSLNKRLGAVTDGKSCVFVCCDGDRSTSLRRLTRGWGRTTLVAATRSVRSAGIALVCTLPTAPNRNTVSTVTLCGVHCSVLAGFCQRLATRSVTGAHYSLLYVTLLSDDVTTYVCCWNWWGDRRLGYKVRDACHECHNFICRHLWWWYVSMGFLYYLHHFVTMIRSVTWMDTCKPPSQTRVFVNCHFRAILFVIFSSESYIKAAFSS